MEQQTKWNPLVCSRPRQWSSSLYRTVRRWVVLGTLVMGLYWKNGKTMAILDQEKCFLPFPLSAYCRQRGDAAPPSTLIHVFSFFVCYEETTWSIWSRLERRKRRGKLTYPRVFAGLCTHKWRFLPPVLCRTASGTFIKHHAHAHALNVLLLVLGTIKLYWDATQ